MKEQIVRFLKDEDGATAIEYGLIAGLIAIAIIVALSTLGDELSQMFGRITTEVQGAVKGQ